MRTWILALAVLVLSFTGTALAATGVTQMADAASDGSLIEMVKPVLDAAMHGQPALACALLLVLAVALARRFAPASWGLKTDMGGTALTFLGSLGAAAGMALTAGSLPSWGLLWTATTIAAGASGGYTAIRRLAAPALRWLEGHAPGWVKPVLAPIVNLLLWAFEGSHKAVETAEKAGQAAVDAKPGKGAAAVAGEPHENP